MRPGAIGLALFLAAPAAGQDTAGALARIRTDYQAVQAGAAGWDSTAKAWTGAGGAGTVTRWRDPAGRFLKLAVRFDGDGASWSREYFFREGALFFAFDRWATFPEGGAADVLENRYAFQAGDLIQWLVRTAADGPNTPQDPTDAAWLDAGHHVPQVAECWMRFLGVPDADWDAWGEETGCAYFL